MDLLLTVFKPVFKHFLSGVRAELPWLHPLAGLSRFLPQSLLLTFDIDTLVSSLC